MEEQKYIVQKCIQLDDFFLKVQLPRLVHLSQGNLISLLAMPWAGKMKHTAINHSAERSKSKSKQLTTHLLIS